MGTALIQLFSTGFTKRVVRRLHMSRYYIDDRIMGSNEHLAKYQE